MHQILTLTTDFGNVDGYVAAMKGVILGIAPRCQIVDITHMISPHDIAAGSFAMYSACRFFPKGTVHVGVIDPGVGSNRREIVVETDRFVFVGPDNGLFSPFLQTEQVRRVVTIKNPNFKRQMISATFHGRDIFAPVGAHLLQGVSCDAMGEKIDDPITLDLWQVVENNNEVVGKVVSIDHFGNAITMIHRTQHARVLGNGKVQVMVGEHLFRKVHQTYAEVDNGRSLVLYGSLDTLEIAINGGNAAREFGIARGDEVRVQKLSQKGKQL